MDIELKLSKCSTADELIEAVKKLSEEEFLEIAKSTNSKEKVIRPENELNTFYDYFRTSPNSLGSFIVKGDIRLSYEEQNRLFSYLIENRCIYYYDSKITNFLDDILNNLSNGIIFKNFYVEGASEEETEEVLLNLIEAIPRTIMMGAYLSGRIYFKLTNIGINQYYMNENNIIRRDIEEIKIDLEGKEERLQNSFITIAGLMIALFSVIGFNVYSIQTMLTVKAVTMMNISIVFAMVVMFFLIDFIKSSNKNSWRLLPMVVLMIIVLTSSICILI